MKDNSGVFEHLIAGEKCGGIRDMNFFGETRVIATILEPTSTGVILHCGELGMFVFKPDFHLLHFGELLFGEENADALKVVGEHLEGFTPFFCMLSVLKE